MSCEPGGYAGGNKYICQGILFKVRNATPFSSFCWSLFIFSFFQFALDTNDMFDNDDAAIKVSDHELKGCNYYYQADIPNLRVPMIANIEVITNFQSPQTQFPF